MQQRVTRSGRGAGSANDLLKHAPRGAAQIRKSMALKFLSRMEALRSAGEGDDSEAVLALTFASAMGTGLAEGRVTYGVPTEGDRSLLLACLYQLSTSVPPGPLAHTYRPCWGSILRYSQRRCAAQGARPLHASGARRGCGGPHHAVPHREGAGAAG